METIKRASVAIFVAMLFATITFSQVAADSDTSSASITVELPKVSVDTSDGTTIDQCVAYFLMLLSLLLTYIFH